MRIVLSVIALIVAVASSSSPSYAQTSSWLTAPPSAQGARAACSELGQWSLLYWGGSSRPIEQAAMVCPLATSFWGNSDGHWRGFHPAYVQASDIWTVGVGEADFVLREESRIAAPARPLASPTATPDFLYIVDVSARIETKSDLKAYVSMRRTLLQTYAQSHPDFPTRVSISLRRPFEQVDLDGLIARNRGVRFLNLTWFSSDGVHGGYPVGWMTLEEHRARQSFVVGIDWLDAMGTLEEIAKLNVELDVLLADIGPIDQLIAAQNERRPIRYASSPPHLYGLSQRLPP
jgi:hypothetical protein